MFLSTPGVSQRLLRLPRAALPHCPSERVASLNFSWCGLQPWAPPTRSCRPFLTQCQEWLRKANCQRWFWTGKTPIIGKYLFSSLEKLD